MSNNNKKSKKMKTVSPLKEERINYLFEISNLMTQFHPVTGQRTGLSIRNIAHKYVARIKKNWKRKYCKKCWMPLSYSSIKVKHIKNKNKLIFYTHCVWCKHRRVFGMESTISIDENNQQVN